MTYRIPKSYFLLTWLTIITFLFSCNFPTGQQHYERGLSYFKLADHGDYHDPDGLGKAINEFEKGIKKSYTDRDVFDKLTWSYHLLNDDNENSERVYSIGLKYYPKDIEFYFRRGDDRKELKKYKAALDDFDKAIVLDTAKQYEYINDAIYQRGAMRYILGHTINAFKDWQAAQKITNHELRTYDDYCQLWR
jgi:tetratricopeptide (TPR) repeat protein